MNVFKLKPCNEIGVIKTKIKDAILEGTIENEYEPAYQFMLQLGKDLGLSISNDYQSTKK